MASKKKPSAPQPPRAPEAGAELPLGSAKGVAALKIPALAKAVDRYETAKNRRCQESPKEVAAKGELQGLLHKHRDELPKDKDGLPFYRHEERDYCLEEKMKIRAAGEGSDK